MIPENFLILIEKLKEKTAKREALWTKTSRDDEFKLDLGKGAITVDRWQHPETGDELVDIAVINERGDKVDSLYYSHIDKEDFKCVVELHTIAKRAYFRVDETFKTIFNELDSDRTIGIEKKGDDFVF